MAKTEVQRIAHAEREREKRAYRRKHRLCLRCGKPLPEWETYVRCEACRETLTTWRKNKKMAERYGRHFSDGTIHGDSELTKEVRRLMAKYPDMPPTAYGRMKAREYWEAQGVKTT